MFSFRTFLTAFSLTYNLLSACYAQSLPELPPPVTLYTELQLVSITAPKTDQRLNLADLSNRPKSLGYGSPITLAPTPDDIPGFKSLGLKPGSKAERETVAEYAKMEREANRLRVPQADGEYRSPYDQNAGELAPIDRNHQPKPPSTAARAAPSASRARFAKSVTAAPPSTGRGQWSVISGQGSCANGQCSPAYGRWRLFGRRR